MELDQELADLADGLAEAGIEYALCGGIAVAVHGYPRFTNDIDLLVGKEDLDAILDTVAVLGYTLKGGSLPLGEDGPEIYRISKAEGDELLTLDLLLVDSRWKRAFDEREVYEWNNRRIQVVSRAGLADMKRRAGRDQDLLDLKKLEGPGEESD